jgi:serine/threonine-protein kinase ULK/ATG1
MEYCSGGDLSRFIQAKRTLPEWIARKFLRQLGKGKTLYMD